jgi:nitrate/TMAO reductase-like tetraheme cytochrome c subunit
MSQEPQPSSSNVKRKRWWRRWPKLTIDLSRGAHRRNLVIALFLFLVVGLGMTVGSVQAFNYTESTPFCGKVCHSMYPQDVLHDLSPHANVECTKCHVGPGAKAFVQSKIDGTRQLIETILNNYSRPIPSPVHNLRPARETCETCHSPTTFKDNIIKTIRHYEDDQANTPVESTLILKMGGWNPSVGINQGIHWHIGTPVYYIPLDDKRQDIGWIGVQQPDGTLKEYFARDLLGMSQTAFVEKARAEGQIRTLDCIDCHNRAAHYIPYPEQAVDEAITNGQISRDLPYIRKNAVDLMKASYASQDEAYAAIDKLAETYAPSSGADQKEVKQAIATLRTIYSQTNFPDMNLDWQSNPNNERHTPTLGCFRCHDDNHVYMDADGNQQTISAACNLCHTVPIVAQGNELAVEAPVIVGNVPDSHKDFSWTVTHRSITDAQKQECYQCHGQGFCNNAVCHNLSHPPDMLFTHATEYKKQGGQVCYTCHQNITCQRCHPEGIIQNP